STQTFGTYAVDFDVTRLVEGQLFDFLPNQPIQLVADGLVLVFQGVVEVDGVVTVVAVNEVGAAVDMGRIVGVEVISAIGADQAVVAVGEDQTSVNNHPAGCHKARIVDINAVNNHGDVGAALDDHTIVGADHGTGVDIQHAAVGYTVVDANHQRVGVARGLVDDGIVQINAPFLRGVAVGYQLDDLEAADTFQVFLGQGCAVDHPQDVIGAATKVHAAEAVNGFVVGNHDILFGSSTTDQVELVAVGVDTGDIDGGSAVGVGGINGDGVVLGGFEQVVVQFQQDVFIQQAEHFDAAGVVGFRRSHATGGDIATGIAQGDGVDTVVAGDDVGGGQVVSADIELVIAFTQVNGQAVVFADIHV